LTIAIVSNLRVGAWQSDRRGDIEGYGVGHCLEPEHPNMTVLKSFQYLPASLSESNLLLPGRQIRNTSLMEKQLAQIMLDTMHLVCEPLEKRVAELEAQVREFKYVSTWEAEQQYERGNFVTAGGSPGAVPLFAMESGQARPHVPPGTWVAYAGLQAATDRRWCGDVNWNCGSTTGLIIASAS
jgi:hypothetical protein